jgi:protein-L-isoaspartate O-methyltransferase
MNYTTTFRVELDRSQKELVLEVGSCSSFVTALCQAMTDLDEVVSLTIVRHPLPV